MQRIGVRELRNATSQVVRRAGAGERIIVTVDRVPIAEIGPIGRTAEAPTIDDLIATGRVLARQTATRPEPAQPVRAPGGRSTSEVLDQLRDR